MSIPLAIQELINRLNQELDGIEKEAEEGINIARALIARFPNNARLIDWFATLNNALLFVNNFRERIQTIIANISSISVSEEAIQEAGEDLSEYLGRVIESKILVRRTIAILRELQ